MITQWGYKQVFLHQDGYAIYDHAKKRKKYGIFIPVVSRANIC